MIIFADYFRHFRLLSAFAIFRCRYFIFCHFSYATTHAPLLPLPADDVTSSSDISPIAIIDASLFFTFLRLMPPPISDISIFATSCFSLYFDVAVAFDMLLFAYAVFRFAAYFADTLTPIF